MNGTFWQGFWTAVPTLVLAAIGYLSLRYKASVENVTALETSVRDLKGRVVELEISYSNCQEDRHRLIEEKIKLAEELAEAKLQALAKQAAEKILDAESAKKSGEAISQSIKENTEMTAQIAQAVQSLTQAAPSTPAVDPIPVKVIATVPVPVKVVRKES